MSIFRFVVAQYSPCRGAVMNSFVEARSVLAVVLALATIASCSSVGSSAGSDRVDAGRSEDVARVNDVVTATVRAPPLRLGAPAGFAPDTLYFGADIYQSSRAGLVLEEMMREAELPAFCLESADGRRAQWMLGAVLPWNVMVDDPDAWTRVKRGLDAARAAGVPMQLALDVSRWPQNHEPARAAEARGERLCAGYPCSVPFAPTARDFWDSAAAWQSVAARELDAYLGDPVVLLFAMGEPSIDVVRWTLPVPAGYTQQAWVSYQLRLLEQRMITSLRSAVRSRVSVSIRHSPGFLTTPENQLRWGVRPEDFNAVCDETLPAGIMGVDVYESPGRYLLDDDLAIAQRYCTRSQFFFAAELGVVDTAIQRDDVLRWARRIQRDPLGQPSRLLGASVYCWNCIPDPGSLPTSLNADQRRWLGEGFRSLVSAPSRPCAPRCDTHPRWTTPTMMNAALGSHVSLRATMPARCEETEVFVQPCCHTGNCVYAQEIDEDADCPLVLRGGRFTPSGEAQVTFDPAVFRPGWVRVHARGAGAPGATSTVRVHLAP
jgi:hypothetical protein